MKRIVHIAPTLPPAINGLGDFCKLVADNLEMSGNVENVFLVRHLPESASATTIKFESGDLERKLIEAAGDVVVLHYVNYAYSRFGLPFHISSALRSYKATTGGRVLVFFHELYSSSASVLKLPFYTNGMQKRIVKALSRIADATFTSCDVYVRRLEELNVKGVVCTGVFSNVPDYLQNSDVPKENGSLVVFGSFARRNLVYASPNFSAACRRLSIRTIYDIGPGEMSADFSGMEFHQLGGLPMEQVAHYLNRAMYGALSYVPGLLAKSGIYSAYTAFGVIPINLRDGEGPLCDGLEEGRNYFAYKTIEARLPPSSAANAVREWYSHRSQMAISEKIAMCIGDVIEEKVS